MPQGKVKWFDSKKGFGFLLDPEGKDVFVHYTAIEGDGFRTLRRGEEVEFEVIEDEKGKHAKKGVMLTTSSFSADARDYVKGIDSKIALIDGDRLAQLMIDYDLGVSPMAKYEVKRIDSDYFTEQ